MSRSWTITLPIPPRVLSPNARVHHMKKAKFVKEYRTLAHWKGLAALEHVYDKPMLKAAHVTYDFYLVDKRRRDVDNLAASMKHAMDGIVDAGLLADDSCVKGMTSNKAGIDAANPRVEITVREIL